MTAGIIDYKYKKEKQGVQEGSGSLQCLRY